MRVSAGVAENHRKCLLAGSERTASVASSVRHPRSTTRIMAKALTPAAKVRLSEQRKQRNERTNERINVAVAKAVKKERAKWQAKLALARQTTKERERAASAKAAAQKERKRIRFWERKVENGSAVETTDPFPGSFGIDARRTFSY